MATFGRVLTAMVTPFSADGRVDFSQARKLAQALLDSGSDGVVVSGTTGESPTLTRDEKLELFAEVKSAVGNKGAVIAGTGSYNTRESVELTREAEKTGVDGCLLVVPYYNKPTQDGLFEHFKSIAEATSLPCIPYNVPSRTITNLNADTVVKLSQVPNIIGVKEASGNLEQIAKIVGIGPGFLVYSGNDGDTLPMLSLGAYGVISVASHLVGGQIKEMIECFVRGEMDKAAQIHRSLLPLINALFVVSNPIPVKYALEYLGFGVGKCRLPLTPPDTRTRTTVEAALKSCRIDLPV